MPRLSQSIPRYGKHKASGQTMINVHGVDHYLGPHGTAASRTQFDRLIAKYLANGRRRSSIRYVGRCVDRGVFAARRRLLSQGWTADRGTMGVSHRCLRRPAVCTEIRVSSVWTDRVEGCRQEWIDSGMTRQTINKRQFRLARMFKWGVAEELVDSAIWEGSTVGRYVACRTDEGSRDARSAAGRIGSCSCGDSVPIPSCSRHDRFAAVHRNAAG